MRRLCLTTPAAPQDFKRNIKREFAKLLSVLQAYTLVSAKVRIICTNQVCMPR